MAAMFSPPSRKKGPFESDYLRRPAGDQTLPGTRGACTAHKQPSSQARPGLSAVALKTVMREQHRTCCTSVGNQRTAGRVSGGGARRCGPNRGGRLSATEELRRMRQRYGLEKSLLRAREGEEPGGRTTRSMSCTYAGAGPRMQGWI